MKYLLAVVLGVMIAVGGVAVAATQGANGLVFVERTNGIAKSYDQDANVICYEDYQGISCLKNN